MGSGDAMIRMHRLRPNVIPALVATAAVAVAIADGLLTRHIAHSARWFVFGGALLMGLVATVTSHILSRRGDFALRLVDERTAELTEAMAALTATRCELEGMVTGGPTLVVKRTLSPPRVTYVSPNIERLLGHSVASAMREGFFSNQGHPEDVPRFMEVLDKIGSGERLAATLEVRIRNGDGNYRWLSLQVGPDEVCDGRVVSIIAYGIDVDDRHRALEAQRDAHQLAAAANQAKSTFLSRVSHELRTPLNAILGFGQLLDADDVTDEQRESVGHILAGGRHLLQLVNEVLELSTLESGQMRLTVESINPGALVRECVTLITPATDAACLTVSVEDHATNYIVRADPQRFKQVMLNLLSNAAKYNRVGGSITVTLKPRSSDAVSIAIRDTGYGIAASRLDQLFVPFERLGAERTDVEGIGLGLCLARQLARAMHGDVFVTSTAGRSSTFTVELPGVEDRQASALDSVAPHAAHGFARSVVHMEDNLINLRLVEHTLAKQGSFTVMPAMSGSLGLDLARVHRPELVLIDLNLPDMSAEAVMHELRSRIGTAAIPVIILSAQAISHERKAALCAAGAEACVEAPINIAEFGRIIHDALTTSFLGGVPS